MPRTSLLLLSAVALFASPLTAQSPAAPLSAQESAMARSVDAHAAADRALLEKIININSGTMNLPGVVAVGMLGEDAHAPGEKAWLDSFTRQAKRNAVFMHRLSQETVRH